MSVQTNNCPKCHTPLPRDAPKGLCPECLLRGGFESAGAPEMTQRVDDPRAHTIHIVVPVDEPAGAVPETIRYFGDYELLKQIAVGGMGVVFKARQLSLNRLVAVKMIRAGQLASEADIRRFRTEAEAAANLKHPHIVAIHEVGEHHGQQYFSMDFIEGRSLAELVRERPLEPARAARLVQTVAEAIAYAHQRGVLHRDLKPSNVMLDAQDQPHVTDFGLAKLFEPSRVESRQSSAGSRPSALDPRLTLTGVIMGSPSYMSPEQARGLGNEISVRSDVYSLGAVLYELLTGYPPFRAATPLETMKLVVEREPVGPRTINPAVPRDLETVCLKCLDKAPSRRYASADALAEDLERWLRHEPITARPSTVWERGVKWTRRKPALAGLVAVSAVAVAAVVTVLVVSRASAIRQEERTSEHLYAADIALAQRALDEGNLGQAQRTLASYQTLPGQRDLRGFEWRYLWGLCQGEQVRTLRAHTRSVTGLAFSPDGKLLLAGDKDARWRLWDFASGQVVAKFMSTVPDDPGSARTVQMGSLPMPGNPPQGILITSVAWSPDGQVLAIGGEGSSLLYDAVSYRPVSLLHTPGGTVAFVPHTPLLALAGRSSRLGPDRSRACLVDWQVILRNWQTQQVNAATSRVVRPSRPIELPGRSDVVAVAGNGRLLATGDGSNLIRLWNPTNQQAIADLTNAEPVAALACSADGQLLAACAAESAGIWLWDVQERKPPNVLEGHTGRVWTVTFSPDGQRLASGGADQTVRVWDLTGRTAPRRLLGHAARVLALAFSPDGRQLVSGSDDTTIRVWDLEAPIVTRTIEGAQGPFVFALDGRRVAGRKPDEGTLAIWNLTTGERTDLGPISHSHDPLHFTPQGDGLIAVASDDGNSPARLRTFAIVGGGSVSERLLAGPAIPPNPQPSPPDGKARSTRATAPPNRASFVVPPEGKWALESWARGVVRLWNLDTGALRQEIQTHRTWPHDLRLSPDRRRFTLIDAEGRASVWDAINGRRLFNLAGPDGPRVSDILYTTDGTVVGGRAVGNAIVFSPDGRQLAGGGQANAVYLWDALTGRFLASLAGHKETVNHVAFSSDGRTLASSSLDGSVKLWHRATGREMTTLAREGRWEFLEFAPHGRYLLAADSRHRLHIWKAPSLEELELASADVSPSSGARRLPRKNQ